MSQNNRTKLFFDFTEHNPYSGNGNYIEKYRNKQGERYEKKCFAHCKW
jgi:hypothetical protein